MGRRPKSQSAWSGYCLLSYCFLWLLVTTSLWVTHPLEVPPVPGPESFSTLLSGSLPCRPQALGLRWNPLLQMQVARQDLPAPSQALSTSRAGAESHPSLYPRQECLPQAGIQLWPRMLCPVHWLDKQGKGRKMKEQGREKGRKMGCLKSIYKLKK